MGLFGTKYAASDLKDATTLTIMWLLLVEAGFTRGDEKLDGMGLASQWAAEAASKASDELVLLGGRCGFYTETDYPLYIKKAMRETENSRRGLSLAQYVTRCDEAYDKMLDVAKKQSRDSSIDGTYFALLALQSRVFFQPVVNKIRELGSQLGYDGL